MGVGGSHFHNRGGWSDLRPPSTFPHGPENALPSETPREAMDARMRRGGLIPAKAEHGGGTTPLPSENKRGEEGGGMGGRSPWGPLSDTRFRRGLPS